MSKKVLCVHMTELCICVLTVLRVGVNWKKVTPHTPEHQSGFSDIQFSSTQLYYPTRSDLLEQLVIHKKARSGKVVWNRIYK